MLTTRQETILKLMVDEYVTTATPVASESIARTPELAVSPATVRKEMVELEEAGYIGRPHTSAGTVPLDSAYRLYVESLVAIEMSPSGNGKPSHSHLQGVRRAAPSQSSITRPRQEVWALKPPRVGCYTRRNL